MNRKMKVENADPQVFERLRLLGKRANSCYKPVYDLLPGQVAVIECKDEEDAFIYKRRITTAIRMHRKRINKDAKFATESDGNIIKVYRIG